MPPSFEAENPFKSSSDKATAVTHCLCFTKFSNPPSPPNSTLINTNPKINQFNQKDHIQIKIKIKIKIKTNHYLNYSIKPKGSHLNQNQNTNTTNASN
jgi:hypothetical protein